MRKAFLTVLGVVAWAGIAAGQDILPEPVAPAAEDTAVVNVKEDVPVVLLTEVMEHAVVYQDSAITQLMRDKRLGIQRGQQEADGFRLQVYASNAQQSAKNEALLLQQRLEGEIDVPVYALSEPPFWKVRIGNFRTREEANAYKEVFLQYFPDLQGGTYVVPDKIILVQ